jgi:hypothetical protein
VICWNWCTCKTLATWPRKPGHLAGFFYYFPALRFAPIAKPPRIETGPALVPPGRPPYPARMRFLDLVPGRKPGTRAAPRPPSKLARCIENPQRFLRVPCGGAAGARKKPRPGAGLRGPRCTGRAWWPVDLVTWAAPAGPVAVVPGAQLIAPRLMSTCAVNRSQVNEHMRS